MTEDPWVTWHLSHKAGQPLLSEMVRHYLPGEVLTSDTNVLCCRVSVVGGMNRHCVLVWPSSSNRVRFPSYVASRPSDALLNGIEHVISVVKDTKTKPYGSVGTTIRLVPGYYQDVCLAGCLRLTTGQPSIFDSYSTTTILRVLYSITFEHSSLCFPLTSWSSLACCLIFT
jgi:hypothetical protein